MTDENPTFVDAQARIAKAQALIDEWLRDESSGDEACRRSMSRMVRKIRSALTRCAHIDLRRESTGDVWRTDWTCEDCGRNMIVHRDLTDDEARRVLDGENLERGPKITPRPREGSPESAIRGD